MPRHGQIATEQEVYNAGIEGAKGAINGAARVRRLFTPFPSPLPFFSPSTHMFQWGLYTGILGGALYFFSPVYRSLTFQFKVYLQMSGMTVGSIIEADRRIREYEVGQRRWRKLRRDQEVWKRYEEGYVAENGVAAALPAAANTKTTATGRVVVRNMDDV